jgi:hypothetical protein
LGLFPVSTVSFGSFPVLFRSLVSVLLRACVKRGASSVNVTVRLMSGLSVPLGVVFYKHSSQILKLLRNCYAGETRVADVWRMEKHASFY